RVHHPPPPPFPTRRSSDLPHGFGVLDAVAIQTDPLGHLRVAAQVETESAQTHFPGSPEAVGLAAGDPQRRMGFLHRLGNDRARRDRKSTRLNSSHVAISYA